MPDSPDNNFFCEVDDLMDTKQSIIVDRVGFEPTTTYVSSTA